MFMHISALELRRRVPAASSARDFGVAEACIGQTVRAALVRVAREASEGLVSIKADRCALTVGVDTHHDDFLLVLRHRQLVALSARVAGLEEAAEGHLCVVRPMRRADGRDLGGWETSPLADIGPALPVVVVPRFF